MLHPDVTGVFHENAEVKRREGMPHTKDMIRPSLEMLLAADLNPAGIMNEGGIDVHDKGNTVRVNPVEWPQQHRDSIDAVQIQK
jgi:hypothetical protein